MNPAELRDRCLSLPGAEETFPFGPKTSVFKVAGKMFALSQLGADSLRVSLKCEPELAQALRQAHPAGEGADVRPKRPFRRVQRDPPRSRACKPGRTRQRL